VASLHANLVGKRKINTVKNTECVVFFCIFQPRSDVAFMNEIIIIFYLPTWYVSGTCIRTNNETIDNRCGADVEPSQTLQRNTTTSLVLVVLVGYRDY